MLRHLAPRFSKPGKAASRYTQARGAIDDGKETFDVTLLGCVGLD